MRTAVEFLKERYYKFGELCGDDFVHAEQIETENIKQAYLHGDTFGVDVENGLSASNYYNETFKQQEQ